MESTRDHDALRQQLHEIERGQVASWIEYPATPWWWAPTFGLYALVLTAAAVALDGVAAALVDLALVLVALALVSWQRRRRGTWPRGRVPAGLRGVMARFVLGCVALIVVVGLLVWAAPVGWGLAAAFVGATAGVALYERDYARTAARMRERLS